MKQESNARLMNSINISIRSCNSIDQAEIALHPGALNIKYGPNGLGKSTIAQALTLHTENPERLKELTPFKYRGHDAAPVPTVMGAEKIASVMTFDEDYVEKFVFLPNEVLKNSFDIFIDTPEYRLGMKEISSLFESLKDTFDNQESLSVAQQDFEHLLDAFKVTQTGKVSKSSRGIRALAMGEKLSNVPEDLQGYEGFINGDDPAGWISWQAKGTPYIENSDHCPFCSRSELDKKIAQKVAEEYNSAAVKNMTALREVVASIGRYFEESHLRRLKELTTSVSELNAEQEAFVLTLRGQVEMFLERLMKIRNLSFHTLKDQRDLPTVLRELRLDLSNLEALNSEETQTVVDLINDEITKVQEGINEVRAKISVQNGKVNKIISNNQNRINDFLESAGYSYRVRIDNSDASYPMLLEHEDASGHIEAAANHLSYGEKNAFALILFMYHAIRDEPDLVVLDDPVSSFDKTKKFAILHHLFRGKESLQGLTTLFLTHDIEPAIDLLRTNVSRSFSAMRPVVYFLRGSKGLVTEKPVSKVDIATFSQICVDNVRHADDLIKCIYLRRLVEIEGSQQYAYDVLSNALHARHTPVDNQGTELSSEAVVAGTQAIRRYIPHFDYSQLVDDLHVPGGLEARFNATDVGYEKLQLFRILYEKDRDRFTGNEILLKFVHESYHIENEYIMQLNPRQFDAVPEYVVALCDQLINQSPISQK